MSHFDKMLENPGEKVLSTDLNHISDALSFDLQNLFRGIFRDSLEGVMEGFIEGFNLHADFPESMNVILEPGFGFQFEDPAGSYSSNYKFFRLDSEITIALTAPDLNFYRIDLIQIKHATEDRETQPRDVYNNITGQFENENIAKRQVPDIDTVSILKTGTPGNPPQFPSPDAGYLAAWYVLVPFGAASTIANSNLADARKILATKNHGSKYYTSKVRPPVLEAVTSDATVLIKSGFIESDGEFFLIPSQPLDLNDANISENGLPLGGPAWYFLYLIVPPKNQKGLTKWRYVLSTTKPEASGVPSVSLIAPIFNGLDFTETVNPNRCLFMGSVRTDINHNLIKGQFEGNRFWWDDLNYADDPNNLFIFIKNLTANVDLAVDLSPYIPNGSRFCDIGIECANLNPGSVIIQVKEGTKLKEEFSVRVEGHMKVRFILDTGTSRTIKLRSSLAQTVTICIYGYIQTGLIL